MRDRLLGAYFMHIHVGASRSLCHSCTHPRPPQNIWPLVYKPAFHATTAPKTLLLAMLAAAAIIPVPPGYPTSSVDGESLYQQAQAALHESYSESAPFRPHIQTVQALLLFSLRETSRGQNTAAYMWACRAFGMALELGLHRAGSSKLGQAELETRSRVFWCCYALDKALSEETGRPCLLRARSATVPLPSVTEADEYELWPPPLSPPPIRPTSGRTSRIQPLRSRTISCFNATCKLGHIVEQILDLDVSSGGVMPIDEQALQEEEEWAARRKVRIAKQLDEWRGVVEQQLRIDVQSSVCAPSHWIVNMAVSNISEKSPELTSQPSGSTRRAFSCTRDTSRSNPMAMASRGCTARRTACAVMPPSRSSPCCRAWIARASSSPVARMSDTCCRMRRCSTLTTRACPAMQTKRVARISILRNARCGSRSWAGCGTRIRRTGCFSMDVSAQIPEQGGVAADTRPSRTVRKGGEEMAALARRLVSREHDSFRALLTRFCSTAPDNGPRAFTVATTLPRLLAAADLARQSCNARLVCTPASRSAACLHAYLPAPTRDASPASPFDAIQPVCHQHDDGGQAGVLECLGAACRVARQWSASSCGG